MMTTKRCTGHLNNSARDQRRERNAKTIERNFQETCFQLESLWHTTSPHIHALVGDERTAAYSITKGVPNSTPKILSVDFSSWWTVIRAPINNYKSALFFNNLMNLSKWKGVARQAEEQNTMCLPPPSMNTNSNTIRIKQFHWNQLQKQF